MEENEGDKGEVKEGGEEGVDLGRSGKDLVKAEGESEQVEKESVS